MGLCWAWWGQAEAVAALVNAQTAAAADSALAGMSGGLGAAVAAMRTDAVNLLAELEVGCVFTHLSIVSRWF